MTHQVDIVIDRSVQEKFGGVENQSSPTMETDSNTSARVHKPKDNYFSRKKRTNKRTEKSDGRQKPAVSKERAMRDRTDSKTSTRNILKCKSNMIKFVITKQKTVGRTDKGQQSHNITQEHYW